MTEREHMQYISEFRRIAENKKICGTSFKSLVDTIYNTHIAVTLKFSLLSKRDLLEYFEHYNFMVCDDGDFITNVYDHMYILPRSYETLISDSNEYGVINYIAEKYIYSNSMFFVPGTKKFCIPVHTYYRGVPYMKVSNLYSFLVLIDKRIITPHGLYTTSQYCIIRGYQGLICKYFTYDITDNSLILTDENFKEVASYILTY